MFDIVKIVKTDHKTAIVEIYDDNGTKPPIYLVEIVDEEKPDGADVTDVVFWCEGNEVELI